MGAMLLSVLSRTLLFVVLIIGNLAAASGETAAPPNASVYIISPKDGETVTNPFRVQFVSLTWESRRPASTGQTQVTTIC